MTRTPTAFGTPATRLHGGRIVFVLVLLVLSAFGAWWWLMHRRGGPSTSVTESSTNPGWTAAQLHYEKPEMKAEAPAPPPLDPYAAEMARIRALLLQMQAELEALKNRKSPAATTVVKEAPKPEPAKKLPAPLLFVEHQVKEGEVKAKVDEYVLAPGHFLPCIVKTTINSDVEGYFTSKVSTNVYDSASWYGIY